MFAEAADVALALREAHNDVQSGFVRQEPEQCGQTVQILFRCSRALGHCSLASPEMLILPRSRSRDAELPDALYRAIPAKINNVESLTRQSRALESPRIGSGPWSKGMTAESHSANQGSIPC